MAIKKKKTIYDLPEYAFGSTVGTILGGTAGALIGGPMGASIGMSLGSSAGSLVDGFQAKKEEAKLAEEYKNKLEADAQREANINAFSQQPTNYGAGLQMYPMGGYMGIPNAEVEKQEVAKLPNGQAIMFDGPTHAEGGIQTSLPVGTEITSDRMVDPTTGETFAQTQKSIEMNKDKQTKRLSLRPNDKYLKDSIKLNEGKSKAVFEKQEQVKEALMIADAFKSYMCGGKVKYAKGGSIYDYAYGGPIKDQFLFEDTPVDPSFRFTPPTDYGDPNYVDPVLGVNTPTIPNPNLTDEQMGINRQTSLDMKGYKGTPGESVTNPVVGGNNPLGLNASTLGLGLAGANILGQTVQSFFPDKIDRIENPYRERAIADVQGAVNNQRGLSYDVQDQLTDLTSSEANLNKFGDVNIGSGAGRVANRRANRAQTLRLKNQVYGDRNRANLGIQSQANQMQTGLGQLKGQLGSEQAGFDAMYQDAKLRQKANQRTLRNSATSNAASILQQYGLDQELLKLLPSLFPNSQVAANV